MNDGETECRLLQRKLMTISGFGYVVLRKLIDPLALEQYNRRFLALVEGRQALAAGVKIMRDVLVVKRGSGA